MLFLGDRRRRHAAAVGGRRVQSEAAPAAADLDQLVAARELQLPADEIELVTRRLLEGAPLVAKHRARVGHRGIEECRKEGVSEVVVGRDVAPALAPAIQAQPVPDAVCGCCGPRRPAIDTRRGLRVPGDDPHEGGEVGRGPPTVRVRLRGADGATERQRPVGTLVADLDPSHERRIARRPEPPDPVAVGDLDHSFAEGAEPNLQKVAPRAHRKRRVRGRPKCGERLGIDHGRSGC